MTKLFKKTIPLMLSLAVALSHTAGLAYVLHEDKETEIISRGIIYEKMKRLTIEGFMDIHVLKVDISNPNVTVKPIESTSEIGLKETTTSLVNNNGAKAGINGDFFGISGQYSQSFGTTVADGALKSANNDMNYGKNNYASFIITNDNNPFMSYLNIRADFFNGGVENIHVTGVNKAGNMGSPVIFTSAAIKDTSDLDRRYTGLSKIVVENDVITYVSAENETVTVPENGFIVVVPKDIMEYNRHKFIIGERGVMIVTSNVDLNTMNTALSGGGLILKNGTKTDDTGVKVTGRAPRTAIGISPDKTQVYLVVVDGRGNSIGATHDEMIFIMQSIGAYEAMYLDGGGSSALIAKSVDKNSATIKNTVSDTVERKVINALGVFSDAPISYPTTAEIRSLKNKVLLGDNIILSTYIFDEHYNKLSVDESMISYFVDNRDGYFVNNVFYPSRTGEIQVYANYNSLQASKTITVTGIDGISPSSKELNLSVGQTKTLNISGYDINNVTTAISAENLTVAVNPSHIAEISGNTVKALANGSGYIEYRYNDYVCYVGITVGTEELSINPLNSDVKISPLSYPETVIASTYTSKTATIGDTSLVLGYSFKPSNDTQASYMVFTNPIYLGFAGTLSLDVFGDNSGNLIKARIKDNNGTSHNVDFSSALNFSGWQKLTLTMPQNIAYPVSLERIYVASLQQTKEIKSTICIDNLKGLFPVKSTVTVPAYNTFSDNKKVTSISGKSTLSFISGIAYKEADKPTNYLNVQNQVISKAVNGTNYLVYAGSNDNASPLSIESYQWLNGYNFKAANGFDLINLTAANGSMRNTSPMQWEYFKRDLNKTVNPVKIILIDRKPSLFSDSREYELLHRLLTEKKAEGYEIMVVSTYGKDTTTEVKDGIRYVNLARLWFDKDINKSFSALKINIANGSYTYSIENVVN